MNKYFIFRREQITSASATASDSGVGMSLFAVPAESVAYISAAEGKVFIAFNDATLYQEARLFEGDSIEKSSVNVGCAVGEELQLVEDIVNFITGETKRNVMKFDVLEDASTFKLADLTKPNSVVSKVKSRPINMNTGKVSTGPLDSYEASTGNFVSKTTIEGIDFGNNIPIIDYNPTTISSLSNGATVSTWRNSGSGGETYNLSAGGGTTPSMVTAANQNNFRTDGVQIADTEYFTIPSIAIQGDYTIYMVLGNFNIKRMSAIYGDADGETLGFAGSYSENGAATAVSTTANEFSIRHDSRLGAIASATSQGPLITDGVDRDDDYNGCHVFIVRRDEDSNMFLQNREGEVIAQISGVATGKTTEPGATDGQLLLERLGTTNEINSAYKGNMARFGVISSDIGTNNAANLAVDLFNFYKI